LRILCEAFKLDTDGTSFACERRLIDSRPGRYTRRDYDGGGNYSRQQRGNGAKIAQCQLGIFYDVNSGRNT
jgi:hypothetical protein